VLALREWVLVILLVVLIACVVLVARSILRRMVAKAVSGAKPPTEDQLAQLEKLKGKGAPIRAERAVGDKVNPEGAQGSGALALYSDELVFVHDKEQIRVKIADITDTTQIRALSAMDMSEHVIDAKPDYLLKISWKGGSATFMVADPGSWQASLAQAGQSFKPT